MQGSIKLTKNTELAFNIEARSRNASGKASETDTIEGIDIFSLLSRRCDQYIESFDRATEAEQARNMASLKQAKDELVRTLEILEQKLQLSKVSKKQEAPNEKIVGIIKGGISWQQDNLHKENNDRCKKNSNLPSNFYQSSGDSGLDRIEESTKVGPKEPKYTPEKIAEFAKLGLHLGHYRLGRD
ncbi:uncharacterized protein EAF02_006222 [Botrytis sinoallii]|uniref:uncharacterized protein n=1 Tax=Botrytis sinoallii TaxID=1463999 RepID=UPI0018FF4224|nr:uncharacterized protein EAF02_006222 [Botrytis sinoallii]KAF7882859.1 hypothetical protein EAF02_006222 [Botrytis sinoallii]